MLIGKPPYSGESYGHAIDGICAIRQWSRLPPMTG